MIAEERAALARLCATVHWDADMGAYSTFRTGGRVDALVDVQDLEELGSLLSWLQGQGISWRLIGGGSNILVASPRVEGVFLRLKGGFCQARKLPDAPTAFGTGLVRAGAGCSLPRLVRCCSLEGLGGLEWAVGIPGTVGGALRMNAGAYGGTISHQLSRVSVIAPAGSDSNSGVWKVEQLGAEQIDFGYRSSRFPGAGPGEQPVIVSADFILDQAEPEDIRNREKEYSRQRRASQPQGTGFSAGSFFKNPPGESAGRLIEAAGLKGLEQGDAQVSCCHANFIVNRGQATPGEIITLMKRVQQGVADSAGVVLEPEVVIL
ncbi:UDP-N-acetylmuramate dehydrogenase [Desulfogranum mediterraneum]|uniref:UDP-N-acetylmuramate dehydrogenase n=1 Tax=Desulfogranum mediterraneum TaxID=160661 RepID=UPI00040D0793|nr:UDP-N-acetylmuramate dehydrogenase [Desulfogranum mediterraneum]